MGQIHRGHAGWGICHHDWGSSQAKVRRLRLGNAPRHFTESRVLQRLDGRLMLEQNGNPVPNWVNPIALVAFQAVFPAQHKRLAADGTGENFEEFWGNHDVPIVARKLSAISNK